MNFQRIMCIGLSFMAATICWAQTSPSVQAASSQQGCLAVSVEACNLAQRLGRGVNLGGIFESPSPGQWNIYEPQLIDRTAQIFQTLRVPVRWSNHAGPLADATLDDAFAQQIDTVVDAALGKGMNVILNMHHYNQLFGDKLDRQEFEVDAAVVERRFVNMWIQIAKRYSDRPGRLIFELLNEPHGSLTAARWNDLIGITLTEVRKSNPNRIVMIGPVFWNNVRELPNLRLPVDRNLIATFHSYEPFEFTHQGAPWVPRPMPTGITCCSVDQKIQIESVIAKAAAWSRTAGIPMYLGEFGSFYKADIDSRASYSRVVRLAAEQRGIPWAFWDLSTSFGVYSPQQKAWNEPLRKALVD